MKAILQILFLEFFFSSYRRPHVVLIVVVVPVVFAVVVVVVVVVLAVVYERHKVKLRSSSPKSPRVTDTGLKGKF